MNKTIIYDLQLIYIPYGNTIILSTFFDDVVQYDWFNTLNIISVHDYNSCTSK